MILVFGNKTPNRREVGTLLYLGNDGDEALKVIEENADKYPRITRSLAGIEAHFLTVQHFDENHPAIEKTESENAETPESKSEQPADASPSQPSEPEVTPEPKSKRSRK